MSARAKSTKKEPPAHPFTEMMGARTNVSRPLTDFLEETSPLPDESRLSEEARARVTGMRNVPATTHEDEKINVRVGKRYTRIVTLIHERYKIPKGRIYAYALERLLEDLQS